MHAHRYIQALAEGNLRIQADLQAPVGQERVLHLHVRRDGFADRVSRDRRPAPQRARLLHRLPCVCIYIYVDVFDICLHTSTYIRPAARPRGSTGTHCQVYCRSPQAHTHIHWIHVYICIHSMCTCIQPAARPRDSTGTRCQAYCRSPQARARPPDWRRTQRR